MSVVAFDLQQVIQRLLLVVNDGSAFKPAEDYFCLSHPVGLYCTAQYNCCLPATTVTVGDSDVLFAFLVNFVRCPCKIFDVIVSPCSVHCYLLTHLLTTFNTYGTTMIQGVICKSWPEDNGSLRQIIHVSVLFAKVYVTFVFCCGQFLQITPWIIVVPYVLKYNTLGEKYAYFNVFYNGINVWNSYAYASNIVGSIRRYFFISCRYMLYRTAAFSMTSNDPEPISQGHTILWRWVSQ